MSTHDMKQVQDAQSRSRSSSESRTTSLTRRLCAFALMAASQLAMNMPAVAQWDDSLEPMPNLGGRQRHVAAGVQLDNGDKRVFLFGGYVGNSDDDVVDAYDPVTDTWDVTDTWADMPGVRNRAAVATDADGKIYVIGGTVGTTAQASVLVFDPNVGSSGSWSSIVDMPTPREYAGATFGPDGKLYVIGGRNGSGSSDFDKVERYDPDTLAWETLKPLPPALNGAVSVAAGSTGHLYVIGRYWGSGPCTTFNYEYDIGDGTVAGGTWTARTPNPACLGGRGVVAGPDGLIYAVNDGDFFYPGSGDPNVRAYNPLSDSWITIDNTNVGHIELGVTALGDKIYATGGTTKFSAFPSRMESFETGISANAADITSLLYQSFPIVAGGYMNVCVGDDFELDVGMSGSGPFSWTVTKNGSAFDEGTSSSTAFTLDLVSSMQLSDAADYELKVWNNYNYLTPETILLHVSVDPGSTLTNVLINSTSIGNGDTIDICEGDSPSMTVTATNAPNIDWKLTKPDASTVVGNSSLATFPVNLGGPLLPSDSGTYKLEVWSACNAGSPDFSTFDLDIAAAPIITVQPTSATECEGDTATFSISISGGRANYDYELRKGGVPFQSELDTAALSHSFSMVGVTPADEAADYTIRVIDDCGHIVDSDLFALTVDTDAVITAVTPGGFLLEHCVGDDLTLVVTADGTTPLSWSLKKGTSTHSNGSGESSSFNVDLLNLQETDSGAYVLEVWNDCNADSPSEHSFALSVKEPPTIDVHPVALTQMCEGESVQLVAAASGTPPMAYQWFRDGDPVSGATSPTLSVTDSGSYHLEVQDANFAECGVAASSLAVVEVIGTPTDIDASDGATVYDVVVTWDPVEYAESYMVFRADNDSGFGHKPISGWVSGTVFLDDLDTSDEPVPGHCYFYSVAASYDSATACTESSTTDGYRALDPVTGVAASDGVYGSYVLVEFEEVAGGVHYQVLRNSIDDPNTAERVHADEWLMESDITKSGTTYEFRDLTAVSWDNYFYWVLAGPAGDIPAEISAKASGFGSRDNGFRTCEDLAVAGLCTPDDSTITDDVLLLLLDRSSHMGADCASSLATAKDDIDNFSLLYPDGKIAVWVFSNQCVTNITGGYTDRADADFVVDSLSSSPCSGPAPLADALWMAVNNIRDCTLFAGASKARHISLHSSGVRDSYVPGYFMNGKPDATSGTECADFEPIGVAWESWVCANVNSGTTVNVHNWVDTSAFAMATTTHANLFQSLALESGGAYESIPSGSPPGSGFFPDCNGNGVDDDVDIAGGFSLDCNNNGAPDECEVNNDCNINGIPDDCELAQGLVTDLNGNDIPDGCEGLALGVPSSSVAGLPMGLQIIGATPGSVVVMLAGFVEGEIPMPGCPGTSIGIVDFGSYGVPLLFFLPTDQSGQIGLDFPIPAIASGIDVLFQVIEPGACTDSGVKQVSFL